MQAKVNGRVLLITNMCIHFMVTVRRFVFGRISRMKTGEIFHLQPTFGMSMSPELSIIPNP